jgi:hypothetical protein
MSADQTGYKKPPVKNQFKKGQSGNPKGKPKGSKSMKVTLEEVLQQRMPIRVGGKLKVVTAVYAMFMALTDKALRGDIKAIESVLKAAEKAQLLSPTDPKAESEPLAPQRFGWTEEDETLRPFFEHLKSGPTRSSIFKGGLSDSSNQGKNPEEDKDDRS